MAKFTFGPSGELQVETSSLNPGAVFIAAGPMHHPPRDLPAICRAIYECAGQPVPDLPEVLDPAEVTALVQAMTSKPNVIFKGSATYGQLEEFARSLMLLGYRKQEAGQS